MVRLLLEIAATRVALLLAADRLPLDAAARVPSAPSDQILAALHRYELVNNETLARLCSGHFKLTGRVYLTDGKCEEETLWKIVEHGIISLSLNRTTTSSGSETRLLLPKVVFCLQRDSPFLRDLRFLDIGGFYPSQPFPLLPMLNRFSSLETLFMSEAASLSNADLASICSHHFRLRQLDISNCDGISDISCLRRLKNLEVLRMQRICLKLDSEDITETFRAWSQMKDLDVSLHMNDDLSYNIKPWGVNLGSALLDALDANGGRPFWPRLQSLDLAGHKALFRPRIQLLIDSHSELANLSLLDSDLGDDVFNISDGRQLKIANEANVKQAMHALVLYSKPGRGPIATIALARLYTDVHLSRMGNAFLFSNEEGLECLSLMDMAMRAHSSYQPIQVHGAIIQSIMLSNLVLPTARLSAVLARCMDVADAFHHTDLEYSVLILARRFQFEIKVDYARILKIGMRLMWHSWGFFSPIFDKVPHFAELVSSSELDAIIADSRGTV